MVKDTFGLGKKKKEKSVKADEESVPSIEESVPAYEARINKMLAEKQSGIDRDFYKGSSYSFDEIQRIMSKGIWANIKITILRGRSGVELASGVNGYPANVLASIRKVVETENEKSFPISNVSVRRYDQTYNFYTSCQKTVVSLPPYIDGGKSFPIGSVIEHVSSTYAGYKISGEYQGFNNNRYCFKINESGSVEIKFRYIYRQNTVDAGTIVVNIPEYIELDPSMNRIDGNDLKYILCECSIKPSNPMKMKELRGKLDIINS